MNLMTTKSTVTHFHLYCGSGFGAFGMQEASARVGTLDAEMECLGGVDVDPMACQDFERINGVPATCLDLFDREQFKSWHSGCRSGRKCRVCFNTGEPPAGWREVTPEDIRLAAQGRHPNIVFASPPCKGLSGLQSPKRAESRRYQALNRLTVRGIRLMLDAFEDDPPELVVLENVPLIASRGRPLLDEIRDLLFLYGYAVAETFHDCGELGGLAQRRRRFLLVARHRQKVPPFLYEPSKQRLKGVGEVIGALPMPDAEGTGPMHRCPRLTWETWVRLALIPAGGDWRSLEGMDFTRIGIEPLPDRYGHGGVMGVTPWTSPATTVRGRGGPTNGTCSVQDPRAAGALQVSHQLFQVVDLGQPADQSDESKPSWGGGALGVTAWTDPTGAITAEGYPSNGRFAVQDPRPTTGYDSQQSRKWEVTPFDAPARTVIGANGTGQGASAVQDPRTPLYSNLCRVGAWTEPAHTVTGGTRPAGGALSVADPRVEAKARRTDFQTSGHYGVVSWDGTANAVTAHGQHDNGPYSVADPRPIPAPQDRPDPIPVIIAMDQTWHRPFTTLELAALQFGVDFVEGLMDEPLSGGSHTVWREHIGNAVPRAAARAIGSEMARTLLMARTGQTFALSAAPVWVQPLAAALAVDSRPPEELVRG